MTSKTADNLGAVLHGINDLRVEPISMPSVPDDHVLLQVKSVGICGSDGTISVIHHQIHPLRTPTPL